MKQFISLIIMALTLIACGGASKVCPVSQESAPAIGTDSAALTSGVAYTPAEGYFFKTGQPTPAEALVMRSKEELEAHFGYATTMNRRPTALDFSRQVAIAIVLPETNRSTEITVQSITLRGKDLEVAYAVQTGTPLSYTIQPLTMIAVSKTSLQGKVILVRKN
ncbi:MAG: hypothetical protein HUK03_07120 [Bacteroidaceae bacterium]|nr:hypothetical protein [Bacteroidaceae bacterium]